MTEAKRKRKIQASEIEVNNRTLEGVLTDLAEQVKANDARFAERSVRTEEIAKLALQQSAQAEERSARAEERSARAEELAEIALQTIAAVSQDLRALTQELRASNLRAERRLDALETVAAV